MQSVRRGFTLVELVAVLTTTATVSALCIASRQPAFGKSKQSVDALSSARTTAQRLKDQSQIRVIVQGFTVWASMNGDRYPLPSALDSENTTVADLGRAKDTTADVFSIFLFNGSFSPETCVSPSEINPAIKVNATFEYANPHLAVKPASASWDPGFSADFTKGIGNVSYAHLETSGQPRTEKRELSGRWRRWGSTKVPTDALLGNRGPEIESVTVGGDGTLGKQYAAKAKKPDSNAFKVHGKDGVWGGNIGFNDGHVDSLTGLGPPADRDARTWATYTTKDGAKRLDTLFYDEPDDAAQDNLFLGIFTRAGASPKDFTAIWD